MLTASVIKELKVNSKILHFTAVHSQTYPCNFSVNQILPISIAAIQFESIFLFSQVKLVPSKLRGENYLRISL